MVRSVLIRDFRLSLMLRPAGEESLPVRRAFLSCPSRCLGETHKSRELFIGQSPPLRGRASPKRSTRESLSASEDVMQAKHSLHQTPTHCGRAGLAPLELVLVLPLLAMVAALLLFVAHAGVWKQRAHVASREAVWQTAWPQTDSVLAPPDWRRSDVSMLTEDGPPVWNVDPFEDHPLFRGPQTATDVPLDVNPVLFDGTSGLMSGQSRSQIRSSLWPRLRVTYRFQRDQPLFSRQGWQFDAMDLPSHETRRSLFLFNRP